MSEAVLNVPRYEEVVRGALAQREAAAKAAEAIAAKGYSNVFFIGCGGTYAHYLSFKYMLDSQSTIESHALPAAEFMLMGHKRFSKDSICVFSTRSGNTKEIVAAAEFCQKAGATVVMYAAIAGTPACEFADHLFINFAEDDHLGESIYLINLAFVFGLMHHNGDFPGYNRFLEQLGQITPYLVEAKRSYEDRCRALAERHKDTDYHMVIGSGSVWGEAYDYAMCILEEMQWIRTKSIHAAEFFHGTLELVEKDTSLLLFYGEDETRPLMDRVMNFAQKVTGEIAVFDTKDVDLPLDEEFRKFLSPMIIYVLTERFSAHLAEIRNHPLSTRRYYRQFDY